MGFCTYCKKRVNIHSSSHFFKFPTQNYKEWVQNMGWGDWKPKKSSTLCSDHFTIDCFDYGEYRVRLRRGALPTIFGNSNNGKKIPDEVCSDQAVEYQNENLITKPKTEIFSPMADSGTCQIPLPTTSTCTNRTDRIENFVVHASPAECHKPLCLPTTTEIIQRSEPCKNELVQHDHHYFDTPSMLKKKLDIARSYISKLQSERKALKQRLKRSQLTIQSMKSMIKEACNQKMISDAGLFCLESGEPRSAQSFSRRIQNKKKLKPSRQKLFHS